MLRTVTVSQCSKKVLTMFGSMCLWSLVVCYDRLRLNQRSTAVTDEHLEDLLSAAVTQYQSQIKQVAASVLSQPLCRHLTAVVVVAFTLWFCNIHLKLAVGISFASQEQVEWWTQPTTSWQIIELSKSLRMVGCHWTSWMNSAVDVNIVAVIMLWTVDVQSETALCRRFTVFVTKYNLMSKDNLIVPNMDDQLEVNESEA